ncbi:MAG: PKD-like domain-containing protein, partial [Bacteroidales bacterium]|nr:PKD-like domain-containing protein [Bacteroidales bacterium]
MDNGNWTNLATWEYYNGSTWINANPSHGYPGEDRISGNVSVNNAINLNVSPAFNIGSLTINSTGTLELGIYNFTVLGNLIIDGELSDGNGSGVVRFLDDISISNSGEWSADVVPSSNLQIYGDIDNNSNNVNLERLRIYDDITISGSGIFTVDDYLEFQSSYTLRNQSTVVAGYRINQNNTSGATWINDVGSNLFYYDGGLELMNTNGTLVASAPGNTVYYSGTAPQDIVVPSGSQYANLTLNGTSAKTLLGDIIISEDLTIEAANVLDVSISDYDITIAGDWINNNVVDGFSEGSGTVTFNGSVGQAINKTAGETFYNLVINKASGDLTINGDLTVTNTLTMSSGDVITGTETLILSDDSPASLIHTSGTVVGSMQRALSATSADYLFPIGTAISFRPAVFNFATLSSSVDITAEFDDSAPGVLTPYADGGVSVEQIATDGFWRFRSSSVPTCDYSLELTGNGFTSFTLDADSRMTGRTAASSSWQGFGSHGSVSAPTITRTGLDVMNTTSFDFGFGWGCMLADAGDDQDICGVLTTSLEGNTPNNGTGEWTIVSSPTGSTVTIDDETDPTSGIEVDQYGLYELRWTLTKITGGGCTSSDEVLLGFTESAAAGSDQALCGVLTTTLSGNTPSHGSGLWTVVSSPTGSTVTIDDDTDPTSGIEVDQYGLYELRWTLTNPTGGGCTSSDEVLLGFTESAAAGSDQSLCGVLTTTLSGNTPSHGSGLWTVVSSPTGSTVTIDDDTDPTSGIEVDQYGLYELRWTLTNPTGGGCTSSDEVEIWFESIPVITAQNDTICNGVDTYILPTSVTNPRFGIRYIWTVEDLTGFITGEFNSTGNGNDINDPLEQTLNNSDIDSQKVTYTITPYTIFEDNSLHCPGTSITVDVWVEPTPTVYFVPAQDTICDNDITDIELRSNNHPTNPIRFDYT